MPLWRPLLQALLDLHLLLLERQLHHLNLLLHLLCPGQRQEPLRFAEQSATRARNRGIMTDTVRGRKVFTCGGCDGGCCGG